MIISHKHKFIFLKTRKVGGSSVELALSPYCGPDDIITKLQEEDQRQGDIRAQNYRLPFKQWPLAGKLRRIIGARITDRRAGYYDHISAPEIRHFLGADLFDSYFKFSIERNPWDRQISQYYWECQNLKTRPSFEAYLAGSSKHKRIPNFDIYSLEGKVCVDFMLRYENLETDLYAVMKKLRLDASTLSLPRAKSTSRKGGRDYRQHYTSTSKAIIANWYSREIQEFGYSF